MPISDLILQIPFCVFSDKQTSVQDSGDLSQKELDAINQKLTHNQAQIKRWVQDVQRMPENGTLVFLFGDGEPIEVLLAIFFSFLPDEKNSPQTHQAAHDFFKEAKKIFKDFIEAFDEKLQNKQDPMPCCEEAQKQFASWMSQFFLHIGPYFSSLFEQYVRIRSLGDQIGDRKGNDMLFWLIIQCFKQFNLEHMFSSVASNHGCGVGTFDSEREDFQSSFRLYQMFKQYDPDFPKFLLKLDQGHSTNWYQWTRYWKTIEHNPNATLGQKKLVKFQKEWMKCPALSGPLRIDVGPSQNTIVGCGAYHMAQHTAGLPHGSQILIKWIYLLSLKFPLKAITTLESNQHLITDLFLKLQEFLEDPSFNIFLEIQDQKSPLSQFLLHTVFAIESHLDIETFYQILGSCEKEDPWVIQQEDMLMGLLVWIRVDEQPNYKDIWFYVNQICQNFVAYIQTHEKHDSQKIAKNVETFCKENNDLIKNIPIKPSKKELIELNEKLIQLNQDMLKDMLKDMEDQYGCYVKSQDIQSLYHLETLRATILIYDSVVLKKNGIISDQLHLGLYPSQKYISWNGHNNTESSHDLKRLLYLFQAEDHLGKKILQLKDRNPNQPDMISWRTLFRRVEDIDQSKAKDREIYGLCIKKASPFIDKKQVLEEHRQYQKLIRGLKNVALNCRIDQSDLRQMQLKYEESKEDLMKNDIHLWPFAIFFTMEYPSNVYQEDFKHLFLYFPYLSALKTSLPKQKTDDSVQYKNALDDFFQKVCKLPGEPHVKRQYMRHILKAFLTWKNSEHSEQGVFQNPEMRGIEQSFCKACLENNNFMERYDAMVAKESNNHHTMNINFEQSKLWVGLAQNEPKNLCDLGMQPDTFSRMSMINRGEEGENQRQLDKKKQERKEFYQITLGSHEKQERIGELKRIANSMKPENLNLIHFKQLIAGLKALISNLEKPKKSLENLENLEAQKKSLESLEKEVENMEKLNARKKKLNAVGSLILIIEKIKNLSDQRFNPIDIFNRYFLDYNQKNFESLEEGIDQHIQVLAEDPKNEGFIEHWMRSIELAQTLRFLLRNTLNDGFKQKITNKLNALKNKILSHVQSAGLNADEILKHPALVHPMRSFFAYLGIRCDVTDANFSFQGGQNEKIEIPDEIKRMREEIEAIEKKNQEVGDGNPAPKKLPERLKTRWNQCFSMDFKLLSIQEIKKFSKQYSQQDLKGYLTTAEQDIFNIFKGETDDSGALQYQDQKFQIKNKVKKVKLGRQTYSVEVIRKKYRLGKFKERFDFLKKLHTATLNYLHPLLLLWVVLLACLASHHPLFDFVPGEWIIWMNWGLAAMLLASLLMWSTFWDDVRRLNNRSACMMGVHTIGICMMTISVVCNIPVLSFSGLFLVNVFHLWVMHAHYDAEEKTTLDSSIQCVLWISALISAVMVFFYIQRVSFFDNPLLVFWSLLFLTIAIQTKPRHQLFQHLEHDLGDDAFKLCAEKEQTQNNEFQELELSQAGPPLQTLSEENETFVGSFSLLGFMIQDNYKNKVEKKWEDERLQCFKQIKTICQRI